MCYLESIILFVLNVKFLFSNYKMWTESRVCYGIFCQHTGFSVFFLIGKKKASPNLLRRTWRAHWAVGHPPNGRHVCMYGIREFSFQKTHNTNQVNETLLHGNTHFFMKYRWPIFDARHKLNLSITNLSKRCRIYRHNVRLLAKFHVELEYWTAR